MSRSCLTELHGEGTCVYGEKVALGYQDNIPPISIYVSSLLTVYAPDREKETASISVLPEQDAEGRDLPCQREQMKFGVSPGSKQMVVPSLCCGCPQ